MKDEIIELELGADTSKLKRGLKEARDDIEGFKSRVEDAEAIKLSMNVAELKAQIDRVKENIKEATDEETKIRLVADESRLKQSLTQANRELRNYVRTGEKDVSVLGKLFDGLGSKVDRARLELVKMGKDTKGLDKIEKEINDLNKKFKSGQIDVKAYGSQIGRLEGQVDRATKQNNLLANSLKGISGFLIAGLWFREVTRFVTDSVLQFAEFEKGLARINTVARVSKGQLEALGGEIKNISVLYGQAKDELLDTAFNITSAGVEFQNVAGVLELSSQVAVGAATDTTTAFNGIIAVIKKYGLDLSEANGIAEQFFITNELGQTTIEDLAGAMQNLTSTVGIAGIKTNELFAIYSSLTGVTGDANQVTTQLNGAINALAAPTKEARKQFDLLGVSVGQGAIEEKGFVEVAKEVYDATDGNLELLRKLIPEVEAQKAVVALATTQYDKFSESSRILAEDQGALANAVAEMSDTSSQKIAAVSQTFSNFKTSVGENAINIAYFLIWLGKSFLAFLKVITGALLIWAVEFVGFGRKVVAGGKDIVANWDVVTSNFSISLKTQLNKLPGILQTGLNKLFGVAGAAWKKLQASLGLDKIGGKELFSDVGSKGSFVFTNLEAEIKNVDRVSDKVKRATEEQINIIKNFGNQIPKEVKKVQIGNQAFGSAVQQSAEDTVDSIDSIADATANAGGTAAKAKEEMTAEEKAYQEKLEETAKLEEERRKQIQALGDKNEKVYGEIRDDLEDSVDGLQKYIEKIEEAEEKIKEFGDEAKSNIRDINNELGNIDSGLSGDLGARSVEVDQGILDTKKAIKEELKEGKGYTEEVLALQKELKDLEEERAFINENTTKEQRDAAKVLSELSESQKLVNDANQEKGILEERKKIYEAIQEGEKVNLDEIQDYENLKLAEGLIAKQEALDTELVQAQAGYEQQLAQIKAFNDERKAFESEWTAFFGTELDKQKEHANSLITKLKKIIALQREAGINRSSFDTSAIGTSSSSVWSAVTNNNQRSVDVTINASNNVDVDYALEKVNDQLK